MKRRFFVLIGVGCLAGTFYLAYNHDFGSAFLLGIIGGSFLVLGLIGEKP